MMMKWDATTQTVLCHYEHVVCDGPITGDPSQRLRAHTLSLVLSNLRAVLPSSVWVGTQKEEEEEARMDKLRGKIDNDDALLSNPMLCTMLSLSPHSLGIITHMRRTKMRCD